jgi:predicted glycosyltransferase
MRVWIDLDNSPHVHFFAPILRRLRTGGVEPVITVRDFAQTVELAHWYGMDFKVVGEHRTPRSTTGRIASTLQRATQLAYHMKGKQLALALSHGSRALLVAARILGIPAVTFYDYEFVSSAVFYKFSHRVFVPEVIPDHRLAKPGREARKMVRYPGLKEEVYVYDFEPDPSVLEALGLDRSFPIVTVRPPATWAHYHNPHSEDLFRALMTRLGREPNAQVVVLSRTNAQAQELYCRYASKGGPFRFPEAAVDALSLMCFSDFVFSGGGTMCREAALLGAKAYSTFGGKLGAVDEWLARQGRLTLLRQIEEVEALDLHRNGAERQRPQPLRKTQDFLIDAILGLLKSPGTSADPFPKTI